MRIERPLASLDYFVLFDASTCICALLVLSQASWATHCAGSGLCWTLAFAELSCVYVQARLNEEISNYKEQLDKVKSFIEYKATLEAQLQARSSTYIRMLRSSHSMPQTAHDDVLFGSSVRRESLARVTNLSSSRTCLLAHVLPIVTTRPLIRHVACARLRISIRTRIRARARALVYVRGRTVRSSTVRYSCEP